MKSLKNPRDRFLYKAAISMLSIMVMGSIGVTVLHYLEPDSARINFIIPPVNAFIHFILLMYLFKRPDRLTRVIWIATGVIVAITCIPAWYFTLQATFDPSVRLIETLLPMGSVLAISVALLFVFIKPNRALWVGLIAWVLIAAPILIYLVWHSDELLSPRGLDLAVTLGPVMATILVLVPAYRGVEQRFSMLESEREKMRDISERDALTNLYNRRAAETMFSELTTREDVSVGAILFDIDRFKQINDRYGHNVGDLVLCQVAERCQTVLRKGDIIARWGGEEFLVIVQGIGDRALYGIAETLRLAISGEPIDPVGKVTASFGVTLLSSTDSMHSLLQRADEAMYAAKEQGRDRAIAR